MHVGLIVWPKTGISVILGTPPNHLLEENCGAGRRLFRCWARCMIASQRRSGNNKAPDVKNTLVPDATKQAGGRVAFTNALLGMVAAGYVVAKSVDIPPSTTTSAERTTRCVDENSWKRLG